MSPIFSFVLKNVIMSFPEQIDIFKLYQILLYMVFHFQDKYIILANMVFQKYFLSLSIVNLTNLNKNKNLTNLYFV